jgi:hypothetical protein
VVDCQKLQHRGMPIADADRVLHGVEAELVGAAEGLATAVHPTGQPHVS